MTAAEGRDATVVREAAVLEAAVVGNSVATNAVGPDAVTATELVASTVSPCDESHAFTALSARGVARALANCRTRLTPRTWDSCPSLATVAGSCAVRPSVTDVRPAVRATP